MKETAPNQVQCRLTVGGRVIEFTLDGPLVAMPKKTRKGAK